MEKIFDGNIQVIPIYKKKAIAPIEGCVIYDGISNEGQDFELLSRAALLREKISLIAKKTPSQNVNDNDIITALEYSDSIRIVDSISQNILSVIHPS